MSGISNLEKRTLAMITLMVFVLQFSMLSAAEKAVKVVTNQSLSEAVINRHKSEIDGRNAVNSVLQQGRTATYKDVSEPGLMLEKSRAHKIIVDGKVQPQYRAKNLTKQLKSSAFAISSAYVTLQDDIDGDGYYSEFSVNFDADTDFNHATVYALLYLSLNGGAWELYYTTDYFDIKGWSSYDDFSVRTLLTSGFPPGSYDILIDLYDAYDDSFVASISADESYELAEHYLEDLSYEDSYSGYSEFSIFDASITLLSDNDNDGYYQSFSLQFDADVDAGEALVYAEIWIRDSYGNWQRDHVTEDFIIEGYSTLDTYILETVWESGYNTGYYDFRIELYDAYSSELLTSSDGQNGKLSEVPLEDANSDVKVSSGGSHGPATTVNQGSGGAGSFGLLLIVLLLSVALRAQLVFSRNIG